MTSKPIASSTPSTSADAPAPPPPPLPLPRVFFAVTGFGPFARVTENPTQKVVEGLKQRAAAEETKNKEAKDKEANKKSGSSSPESPSFSLSRSVVKTEVLRVSAADVERWVRVDLEEAARAVAEEVEKGAEAATARAEAAKATTTATTATTTDAAPSTSPAPYHFVAVHLGVYASATTPSIRLETRARNSADFRVPDADGAVLLRQAITTTKSVRRRKKLDEKERERRLEIGLPLARVALRLSEEQQEAAAAGPSSSSSPRPRPRSPPPRNWTVATTDDAGRYLCNFIYWHSLCACRRDGEEKEGQKNEEEGKPLASFLRRPLTTLFWRRQKGAEEQGRRIVRHAVFVHLPPAAVLPVESQLEFVERFLQVLAEELS